jgi:stage II sporulation protein AA (anti-sigma F factor antagonist)
MEIRINTEKEFLVFYLSGNIDIVRAGKLDKEIQSVMQKFPGFHILFSLRDTGLVSSSGFGMIINYQRKKSREGIRIAVSNLSMENKRILDLMGIEGMIEIYSKETDFESMCGNPFV